jgi:hypothetical protein
VLSILTVVLVGLFVGWWFGNSVDGWKSYPLAILAALVVVPAFGVLAAYLDVMLFGGSQDEQTGIAVGLGLGCPKTAFSGQILCPIFGPANIRSSCRFLLGLGPTGVVQKMVKSNWSIWTP